MDSLSAGARKSGRCRGVAVIRGSTVVPRADKPMITLSLPHAQPPTPGSLLLSLSHMGYREEMPEISDKLNPHLVLHLKAAWLNG